MDDEDSKSKGQSSTAILGILWIVVFANTSKDIFDSIGSKSYYNLAETITYGSISIISALVLCAILCIIGTVLEDYVCGRWMRACGQFTGVITTVGIIAIWFCQFVFMCIIMYEDPRHNFIGYGSFWTEGTLHWEPRNATLIHPSVSEPDVIKYPTTHWPYEMGDILVRISWGGTMIMLFIIAGVGVIAGIGWVSSKIKG